MRIARPLRAIGRGARRVADLLPLTPLGLSVAAAAGAALWLLAYQRMDLVLLVVGYGALGLVALALLAVLLAAAVLKLRLRRRARAGKEAAEPVALETGVPHETGFSLPSLRWIPLLQLRWSWERPAGVQLEARPQRGRLREQVTIDERGEIGRVRRRVLVQDAFGLARLGLRGDEQVAFRVIPRAGALRRMPLLTSLAGGDEQSHPMGLDEGDRVELRRYVPGDPARFIHWKVFGRTRRLMVRVPERALSRARRVVAYQVAGPDDDASAGAARVAVETGALGAEWTFGADGGGGVGVSRPHEALELVVGSVAARDRGGEELSPFVERAEREGGPATIVVFAPPREGPWLERALALARARRGRIRVVIAVDGVHDPVERPWWKRLLTRRPSPPRGVEGEALDAVLRALGSVRCDVVLLDRSTGKRIGEGHRAAMRRHVAAARDGDGTGARGAPEIAA